ncbi:hypothetical protein TorRG33x02_075660, partial [Trema orientale]
FAQQNLELFHCAWTRYKELLINFPNHGFSQECQLQIFLYNVWPETRMWVERRDGTAYFHQLSADETYWLLEGMADFDYQSWNYPISHLNLGDNSNSLAPLFDTLHYQAESSLDLEELLAQFSEETRLHIEKLERMEMVARNTQDICNCESHREEMGPSGRIFGLFDDDYSSEEKVQDNTYESQPFDIQVIMPPAIQTHIYNDPMWPKPPPPSLAPVIEAHHAHVPKPNQVEHTCRALPYIAKLESVRNQGPYILLYDT